MDTDQIAHALGKLEGLVGALREQISGVESRTDARLNRIEEKLTNHMVKVGSIGAIMGAVAGLVGAVALHFFAK